jgi:hypothetical protein
MRNNTLAHTLLHSLNCDKARGNGQKTTTVQNATLLVWYACAVAEGGVMFHADSLGHSHLETHHSNLNDDTIALEDLVQHRFCAVFWDVPHEQFDSICCAARRRFGSIRPGHILRQCSHNLGRSGSLAIAKVCAWNLL